MGQSEFPSVRQKTLILSIISLRLIVSIAPNQARVTTKETTLQKSLLSNENVVTDITVTWDSFLHRFSLKDLAPNVTITQSSTRDFYFPEINGSIPQLHFTVTCKHKLISPVIFPRFTRVYIAISYNDTYTLLHQSKNHRCQNLEWEYINLTVDSNNGSIPLVTNGSKYHLRYRSWSLFLCLWVH